MRGVLAEEAAAVPHKKIDWQASSSHGPLRMYPAHEQYVSLGHTMTGML